MYWLFLILYIYFKFINEGLCFVNYTVHSVRKSWPSNVHDRQLDSNGIRYRNAVFKRKSDYIVEVDRKTKVNKINSNREEKKIDGLNIWNKVSKGNEGNKMVKLIKSNKGNKDNKLGRGYDRDKGNKDNKNMIKEDLEELFSKDNDERRLIKQKEASLRYFSEIRNPLLNRVAHDSQKKASDKIKILAKRAERKTEKYYKEIEKKIENRKKMMEMRREKEMEKKKDKERKSNEEYKDNKSKENRQNKVVMNIKENKTQEENPENKDKDKEDRNEEENKDDKTYRRSKITEKELRLLPLRVPGIRSLEEGFSEKFSVEEFDSLIKLGYNGIVDMNSLFLDEIEEKYMRKGKVEKDRLNNRIKEIEGNEEKQKEKMKDDYIENKEKSKVNKEVKNENISDSEFVNVSFESLGIYDKNLIQTLKVKGVKKPTYTQKRYIPELTSMMMPISDSVDEKFITNIIHASTGSGKTLTYMLPIFQSCFNQTVPLFSQGSSYDFESMLMYIRDLVNQDILVICPSLELCVQSCKVAKDIYDEYEYINSENEEISNDNKEENPELRIKIKDNKEEDYIENKQETKVNKEVKNENKKERNEFYSEFSKMLGIESEKYVKGRLRVKTEIRPTLLIGNANVIYQKKNIKKIDVEKYEDYRVAKNVIEDIRSLRLFAREATETADTIKRTVGMYFATPGRLHSILFKHKLLDLNNFKYIVMDEYDSYLDDYKKYKDENKKIRNNQTKELIQKIFNQLPNRCGYMKSDEIPKEFQRNFLNLGKKYVMCVSASDNIDLMPECLKKQILKNYEEKGLENLDNKIYKEKKEEKIKESQELKENVDKTANKSKTTYQFPKNILHTMAIYSVPDAKLSLLRKILKSVPYNKSVLIFCDSNGTANFLFKYLSEIFKDSSIELLNSVQNRLNRRKAFSNVIQTNIDNTNLYNSNKKTTRLVKDILISTRLNSRGIDFSGYTHVINYDLPHDSDSYIHKSGRIGRAGNPGICISLVESKNLPAFKRAIVNHLPLQFHTIDSNNGLIVTKS